MKSKLILLVLFLIKIDVFCQDTIYVNNKAKTYLIFDNNINFADYDQDLINGASTENTLLIQAIDTFTNDQIRTIVVKHGNDFKKSVVMFKSNMKPSEFFYDFRKPKIDSSEVKEKPEFETGEFLVKSGLNKDVISKMKKVFLIGTEEKLYGHFSNDHIVTLDVVRMDDNYIYLKIKFKNTSTANYTISKVDFDIQEKGKISTVQEIHNFNMSCVAYNNVNEIKGKSEEYLVYAVPLFSSIKGIFHVLIRQKNGNRTVDLEIPLKFLHNSKFI